MHPSLNLLWEECYHRLVSAAKGVYGAKRFKNLLESRKR